MELNGVEFMLHSDHTYDHHPLSARLQGSGKRGDGAELRVMGIDPDDLQERAEAAGATILQPAADFPHGWRDVILEDPDGYIWAVGVPLEQVSAEKSWKRAQIVTLCGVPRAIYSKSDLRGEAHENGEGA